MTVEIEAASPHMLSVWWLFQQIRAFDHDPDEFDPENYETPIDNFDMYQFFEQSMGGKRLCVCVCVCVCVSVY